MQAFNIGPLTFTGDKIAAIVGVAVFLIVTSFLERRIDRRLGRLASQTLIASLIAARFGHVIQHASNFAAEPWRIAAVWQGGFSPWWGLAAAALVLVVRTPSLRLSVWTAFAFGSALIAWNAVYQLTSSILEIPLPLAVFNRLDGRRMTLGQTDGKPIIINLWASWCPPCRREMPLMAETAAHRSDVAFLFVNQGEDKARIDAYLASSGLSLSNVLLDHTGDTARHYQMPGLPATLFISADGRLQSIHTGEISREELDDNIARLVE